VPEREAMTKPTNHSLRSILRVPFNLVSYQDVLETIDEWRSNGCQRYITITNPHSVMLCTRDAAMDRATYEAGLTLPDGVGIIWAARILGYPHRGRATGPTLMLRLCDAGRERNYRHFFYGGSEGVADRVAELLSTHYRGLAVAGTYCPPFRKLSDNEDQQIVDRINATKPDIVWVGLGAPKQEKWMADHVDRIHATAMIGVGAAFDFHSGNIKWAPGWIRKIGMEWAYRFALEPRRMWRRNLDSPLFLMHVVGQRISRTFGFVNDEVVRAISEERTWRPRRKQ
jgi:N-acetylglucosaminyldiphosphoundecaprenol N-acetyl-beta-D-mannosaminyltransferase